MGARKKVSAQHTLLQQKLSSGSVFYFQAGNEGEVPGELPNHYRWLKIFNSSLLITEKYLHF